jgi:hypothetical protein
MGLQGQQHILQILPFGLLQEIEKPTKFGRVE